MYIKKILAVFEYTLVLLKKYNEIKQADEKNIYRIIELKKTSSNQLKLIIQIVGKSSIIECYPHEIVAVDRLLEGFSKKDVRTITYLACNKIDTSKYKIITQNFCSKINKIIFKLKENENSDLIFKTAGEIVLDKNIINNLSREDIYSITYIAGYESAQNIEHF